MPPLAAPPAVSRTADASAGLSVPDTTVARVPDAAPPPPPSRMQEIPAIIEQPPSGAPVGGRDGELVLRQLDTSDGATPAPETVDSHGGPTARSVPPAQPDSVSAPAGSSLDSGALAAAGQATAHPPASPGAAALNALVGRTAETSALPPPTGPQPQDPSGRLEDAATESAPSGAEPAAAEPRIDARQPLIFRTADRSEAVTAPTRPESPARTEESTPPAAPTAVARQLDAAAQSAPPGNPSAAEQSSRPTPPAVTAPTAVRRQLDSAGQPAPPANRSAANTAGLQTPTPGMPRLDTPSEAIQRTAAATQPHRLAAEPAPAAPPSTEAASSDDSSALAARGGAVEPAAAVDGRRPSDAAAPSSPADTNLVWRRTERVSDDQPATVTPTGASGESDSSSALPATSSSSPGHLALQRTPDVASSIVAPAVTDPPGQVSSSRAAPASPTQGPSPAADHSIPPYVARSAEAAATSGSAAPSSEASNPRGTDAQASAGGGADRATAQIKSDPRRRCAVPVVPVCSAPGGT